MRKNDQIWPFFALLVGIQPEFRCFFDGPQADLITGQLPIPLFVVLQRDRSHFYLCLQGFMHIVLQDDKFTATASPLNRSSLELFHNCCAQSSVPHP